MSDLITIGRDILAVCSPATGTRATGTLLATATDADINVPVGSYLIPNINGQLDPNMPFKVGVGPNADKSWTVTASGTAVDAFSNIGGAKFNVEETTPFLFDPEITGIASVVADGNFANGAAPTGLAALADAVVWESMDKPISATLHDTGVRGFPAAILAWQQSEPADGATDGHSSGAAAGSRATIYRETFGLSVISSKSNSSHYRSQQGLVIMGELCALLQDRHAVDGRRFSVPRGIQIIRRYRENGASQFYKRFYVYTIVLGIQHLIEQRAYRSWNDWLTNNIDVLTMQRPPLENQGDHTTVDDMEVEMVHD